MSREIKFRGRRTDTKEWVYGSYFKQTASQLGENVPLALARVCHCIMVYGEEYFHVDAQSVGQYTGLKDKNGKEIYEGDIIGDENIMLQVKYLCDSEHSCFALFNWVAERPNDEWWGFEHYTPEYMEVIGNIHENPELLEKEQ